MKDEHNRYIQEAIEMASENARTGNGGPFGAIVVLHGTVIGRGVNKVTQINDPTAHAEVMAIRDACKHLNNFKLDEAVIYTSCEPCPMCLSAIYWARIKTIYFAAQNTDAAKAGFDDSTIYKEIRLPIEKRSIPAIMINNVEAFKPFQTWISMEERIDY
jgi:guanine deaminase